ncbi:L,D-transpeptidase [Candidatus Desulforudis audaxviator]|uniref:L,D-transpeptidase n=1 Tax=Candidatus Desulforudis audaxviator TaxID=471827 RepID=UPI00140FA324|nr:L,D-transpeptidase [Candidatus Desulforudis audaxviator]
MHTRAVSSLGEEARVDFSFRTLEMGDRMWVAVDLEGEHNVTVYRGSEVVRVFKASGGKVTTPPPWGRFFSITAVTRFGASACRKVPTTGCSSPGRTWCTRSPSMPPEN